MPLTAYVSCAAADAHVSADVPWPPVSAAFWARAAHAIAALQSASLSSSVVMAMGEPYGLGSNFPYRGAVAHRPGRPRSAIVPTMTSRPQEGVRRALDFVIALVLMLCVLPVLIMAMLAIAISNPGASVFFRQQRTGRGGRPFWLYKLRTMCPDAEARKVELRELSEVPWPDFRLTGDPRVTRLGRVLRRTSLDELPQFLNVLKGDMALVGPRPTSFAADTYEPWQLERLEVRPGLTGPWQLDGRSTVDFEGRCRMEIAFIRKASLRRHLVVLARTPMAVLRRTGVA